MPHTFDQWYKEFGSAMPDGTSVRGIAYAAYSLGVHEGRSRGVAERAQTDHSPEMHPDLEWLAKLPHERFQNLPGRNRETRTPRFGKGHEIANGEYQLVWGYDVRERFTFTLEQIQQARKFVQDDSSILEAMKQVREVFAERDHLNNTLANLPDYETWFETHGKELTVRPVFDNRTAATVHELYTHFRARLLDELRGAGVIGEGS